MGYLVGYEETDCSVLVGGSDTLRNPNMRKT
jgi:hypothetical protein